MDKIQTETVIHPSAVVHPKAQIGKGVKIGPYVVIGEHTEIGDRSDIQEHASIRGHTRLGSEVTVFPFALVGAEPQHLHYRNEPTLTEVGDRTTIREFVTIHRGTPVGTGKTVIGTDTFLMAYAHVAHDCQVGSHVIICNSVQLAGHVIVEDRANIGGLTGVVQFCRVGKYCYVGGGSLIRKDLPPYLMGKGNEFEVQGVNAVGLTRSGMNADTVQKLKQLYKIFYLQNLTVSQAIEKAVTEFGTIPEVQHFIQFIQNSKMGFAR
ncbi:acyl-ACP--UDP-N-acetylglucosamine O-acyltransferase [bacterium]|nr:acyl-ACP--UDP-N-acetylglucosamine O-acyltransferase [bacterium]